jgi:hypothetical protein
VDPRHDALRLVVDPDEKVARRVRARAVVGRAPGQVALRPLAKAIVPLVAAATCGRSAHEERGDARDAL